MVEELPEHRAVTLLGARKDYLNNLRGHTPDWDWIQHKAKSLVGAMNAEVGVPDQFRAKLQELIEGQLVLEHKARLKYGNEIEREIANRVRRSEKTLLAQKLQGLISDLNKG